MNNKIKVLISILVAIILAVVCGVAVSKTIIANKEKKEDENTNKVENTQVENSVDNTLVENIANGETTNNVKKDENNEKIETQDFTNSVFEDDTSTGTTNKKQEAINLVKQQWGEDDTVTFSCDSITSDGIYVIAVTSKERAVVLNYFRVNLDNKVVTIDY